MVLNLVSLETAKSQNNLKEKTMKKLKTLEETIGKKIVQIAYNFSCDSLLLIFEDKSYISLITETEEDFPFVDKNSIKEDIFTLKEKKAITEKEYSILSERFHKETLRRIEKNEKRLLQELKKKYEKS